MSDEPDKGEKAQPQAANAPGNEPAGISRETTRTEASAPDSNLPVIWSPRLDAGEAMENESPTLDTDEAAPPHDESTTADAGGDATAAPPARSSRFALLAATLALAAALGSFVGSLSGSAVGRLVPAGASSGAEDATSVVQAMKAQLAELSAIKTKLDGATRDANTQFAKIADRLDHVERAEAEPATKIAHISDTVDRLDKRASAAPDVTGSIASPPAADAKITDRILEGWVVQDVQAGRALIENRNGGLFDVGTGSVLPGVGRVDAIKRQDGQWIVLTARGTITSGR